MNIEEGLDLKDVDLTPSDFKGLLLGLEGTSKAFAIAKLYKQSQDPQLVIVPSLQDAQTLHEDLQLFLKEEELALFPTNENVAADFATASPELLSEQIKTLIRLTQGEVNLIIAPLFALKKPIYSPEHFKTLSLDLKIGDEIEVEEVTERLVKMGYKRVEMVLRPGEMSVRGDIIDAFPLDQTNPIRLSIGFDEVERLRVFDPDTQRSEEDLTSFTYYPVSLLTPEAENLKKKVKALEKTLKALKETDQENDSQQALIEEEIEAWKKGEATSLTPYFKRLYMEEDDHLLAYFKEDSLYIEEYAQLMELNDQYDKQAEAYLKEKIHQGELPPIKEVSLNFVEELRNFPSRKIFISEFQRGLGRQRFSVVKNFQTRTVTPLYDYESALKVELDAWLRTKRTIVMLLPTEKQRRNLEGLLEGLQLVGQATSLDQLFENKINLVLGDLSSGIELVDQRLVFLTSKELFRQKKKIRRHSENLSNAERLMSYQELKPGDYVVHINHGIGQYLGVETIEFKGNHQDYMTLVYADNAMIHVPIDQIQLVQKYVSSEGKTPHLNKMGGSEWAKTKQRVRKEVEDIADDLIELYAEREAQEGFAFSEDNKDQEEFEEAFPYPETPDQLRSSKEIKADMEKKKPMDRLLIGDVGFGKTEVALRAAFKAMLDGKQVAFLVPTTILSEQHYETITERLEDYPFNIALMNRFQTPKQQKETLKGLKEGSIQLVVGTHRLLSKDVQFLDLGLLIVDEEQRFGVKAKETMKALKHTVDVLTLTATPIPRTLNMSMIGVRDLSVIETPPANRYPVQTYVLEQNNETVREAIVREIARDGQIFYLFNNVKKIYEKAAEIQRLVPDARIAVAHGQMPALQLEEVMRRFLQREYDVLVTTTIIETGVDMPNVNTLLVEKADRMGLSTLYQLRGRVGRSHRIAYAYFMFQANRSLNETSQKRLLALRDFTELGSGFKIAMRDLSIRGAGNLLGSAQHGFVNSVGYDLYQQMLEEAISAKQGKRPKRRVFTTEINLPIDAYLPSTYISDDNQKVEMYQQIRKITSIDEMWEVDEQLSDRFGEPPLEVQRLLMVGGIQGLASQLEIEQVKQEKDSLVLLFSASLNEKELVPDIFDALGDLPFQLQVAMKQGKVQITLRYRKMTVEKWLNDLLEFLQALKKLKESKVNASTQSN